MTRTPEENLRWLELQLKALEVDPVDPVSEDIVREVLAKALQKCPRKLLVHLIRETIAYNREELRAEKDRN